MGKDETASYFSEHNQGDYIRKRKPTVYLCRQI